ncbi:hypothetical protein PCANC_13255 [Puccinia coronata f. sp. avenae]|uniref:BZIP domain-containing protein n=1 Tax=Puccinia coronata f. sp. avenae TaxID=200324 RepID=A0A2N5V0M4_9BASI|nr:hypothetical protein PCANC_21886 [Puccinia coronata f. sp. avenae]PLW43549.1 hypothetical protein PCANC_13255 [Puccinia coronata f. sp. avenae]
MPRQPLADTPGLPPYGQRSSERRKEQNRIAQRQLRERRQHQEAAQALKLQQQQNEIRRLHRLINELRNENFALRSQSHTRRRQSVIPISSLSRGLGMSHAPATTTGPLPTLEPNCKPFLARHSIDYSSLHGAGLHAGGSSHRLYEQRHFKSWNSEDQRAPSFVPHLAPSFVSHLRQSAPRATVQHPGHSAYGHPASRGSTRLQICTGQDIHKHAESSSEKACSASSFCGKAHSSGISNVPMTSKPPASNWTPRNVTPPLEEAPGDSPTNGWLNSPQKLQQSPQLNSTPKTESNFFTPSSVDVASFWPTQPPTSPNKHEDREEIDRFSAPTLSVVPSEFFPASNTSQMSSDRTQLRKTSESAGSDTNSLAPDSDNHSSFSTLSIDSVHFPFISPELLSHHVARCLSPTATGSSPEAQMELEAILYRLMRNLCFWRLMRCGGANSDAPSNSLFICPP